MDTDAQAEIQTQLNDCITDLVTNFGWSRTDILTEVDNALANVGA